MPTTVTIDSPGYFANIRSPSFTSNPDTLDIAPRPPFRRPGRATQIRPWRGYVRRARKDREYLLWTGGYRPAASCWGPVRSPRPIAGNGILPASTGAVRQRASDVRAARPDP